MTANSLTNNIDRGDAGLFVRTRPCPINESRLKTRQRGEGKSVPGRTKLPPSQASDTCQRQFSQRRSATYVYIQNLQATTSNKVARYKYGVFPTTPTMLW